MRIKWKFWIIFPSALDCNCMNNETSIFQIELEMQHLIERELISDLSFWCVGLTKEAIKLFFSSLSLHFAAVLFVFIHTYKLWMSHCLSWVGTESLTQCGGGWAETAERCRSLKVKCERDVAEQALWLCYTVGSVSHRRPTSSPSPLFLYVSSFSSSDVRLCPHLFYVFLYPKILPFSVWIIVNKPSPSSVWQYCF